MVWTRYGLLQKERISMSLASQFPPDSFYMILVNTQSSTKTFNLSPSNVNSTNNTINIINHGLETGMRVFFNQGTSSTLPGGVEEGVFYYVIRESSSLIKLVAGFDNYLTALRDIANGNPISTILDITGSGSGSFTMTVNPALRTDDFIDHVVSWECTNAGYQRKRITIPEPSFGSPNNRVNFPDISLVVEADTEDIEYNYIAILAGANSTIGSDAGVFLCYQDVGSVQTIPQGFGFTFVLSFAGSAVSFSTPGIN